MNTERPIDRLLQWAVDAGMNQSDLARLLGMDPQNITNWKARGLPPERYELVVSAFGRSIDELLGHRFRQKQANLKGADRTAAASAATHHERIFRVPVVGTAQLGPSGYWTETEHPVGTGDGYIDMPSRDRNAYAVRVVGDSMYPRIKSGEFVVVEPNHVCEPGDEVLVVTKDGRRMVKELLFRRNGAVALQSVNADHARLTLREDEIEKIHYVAAISKSALYMPEDPE